MIPMMSRSAPTRTSQSIIVALILLLIPNLQAATGTLFPNPWFNAFDTNGNPVSGAKACFYTAGTSTPATTYSDVTLLTPNSNPVVADSAGRVGPVYLTPGSSYKLVLQDATGTAGVCDGAVIRTQDNIAATPTSSANLDIAGTAGEALTAGQVVYVSDGSGGKTQGQWYKADSTNLYSSVSTLVGMVPANIASGGTGTVRLQGQMTGLSALTIGSDYFVSATPGTLTVTAPTNRRFVGRADSSTTLLIGVPSYVTLLPALTNGQVMIGSTGAFPAAATLTAGSGISVTNAAGAITLATSIKPYTPTLTSVTSVAETDVISWTVGASEMADGDVMLVEFAIQIRNSTGGAITPVVKFKWGATSATLTSAGWSSIATTRNHLITFRVQRVGSDLWILDPPAAQAAPFTSLNGDLVAAATAPTAQVMSAPTFTSSQTVKLTVTLAAYNATNNFWNTMAARVYRVPSS